MGRLLLMCVAAELSLPTADALSLQHACSRPLPHPIAHPCPSTHSTPQVHVFETTIRVLGGLLSGHVLLSRDPSLVPEYDSLFLRLATDLADRMLPAFDTRTGLPGNFVHLQKVRERSWAPLLVQLRLARMCVWCSLLPPATHMGSLAGRVDMLCNNALLWGRQPVISGSSTSA